MHDETACSLCGARNARKAIEVFLRTMTESSTRVGEFESSRRSNKAELARLKTRIRTLESQTENAGHDNLLDHRTQAERTLERVEAQARESAKRRPRQDNSREAIRIFKENAHTRKGAGEF